MTIEEVMVQKRWMRLALPDDFAQCVALAKLMAHTPHSQAVALDYLLRQLRWEVWDRLVRKAPARPDAIKPCRRKTATGYRTDSQRKRAARAKLSPELRSDIARKAAAARWGAAWTRKLTN